MQDKRLIWIISLKISVRRISTAKYLKSLRALFAGFVCVARLVASAWSRALSKKNGCRTCTVGIVRTFLPSSPRPTDPIFFAQPRTSKSEAMTDPAALADVLRVQQAANHATIAANTQCDPSYRREYNLYVKWVQNEDDLDTQVAPFLTRTNVDHYFTRVVSSCAGTKNTIRRVLNALDWYAVHREHISANPAFVCTSHHVETALAAQVAYNKTVGGTGRAGSDPHLGLKDILPDSDQLRMMAYIYRHRADWGPASISFTWGMNGAVRGASNRVLVYSDLNLSYGFGPERSGPLSRALLLVLRSGVLHKDRHETSDQVCVWRHQQWLLCSVFSTAM